MTIVDSSGSGRIGSIRIVKGAVKAFPSGGGNVTVKVDGVAGGTIKDHYSQFQRLSDAHICVSEEELLNDLQANFRNASVSVEQLTEAQYNALPTEQKNNGTLYLIS